MRAWPPKPHSSSSAQSLKGRPAAPPSRQEALPEWRHLRGALEGRPGVRPRPVQGAPPGTAPHLVGATWSPRSFLVLPSSSAALGPSAAPLPPGPCPPQWANGNEYNGEWVAGKMCGRGTFVWVTGERYDGEWKDGKENGRGARNGGFGWPRALPSDFIPSFAFSVLQRSLQIARKGLSHVA